MLLMKDLYWLAGLIEGEGCFMICKRKKITEFKIAVCSTDRDVIDRSSKLFGCTTSVDTWRTIREGKKPIYRSTITGKKAISWMMTLYSLMGLRRKAKIVECIDVWKSYTSLQNKLFIPRG